MGGVLGHLRLPQRQPPAPSPNERRDTIRRLLTTIAIAAAAGVAPYTTQAAKPDTITLQGPRWVPPLIRRLAMCETHGNPRHRAYPYGGIVGWYVGTWQLDRDPGMPVYPWNATLRQQVRVAIRSVYVRGRYFGCLSGPEHAWVRG